MTDFGQQYAWAAGHDVALSSLNNVANQLYPHNYRTAAVKRYPIGISSPAIDMFPVRTMLAAAYERGDGRVDHEWAMVISAVAYDFALDSYLSSGTVVRAPVTIYTRLHGSGINVYGRFNCYLTLPSRSKGSLEYLRQNVVRVRWDFTQLVAL